MKKILFVCTGNSCRSVMAEGLLKQFLEKKGRTDVQVLSAGTGSLDGIPPTPETIEAMQGQGVDVSGHVGQQITPQLVRIADVIFCMENAHRERILSVVPEAESKVHLLKVFENKATLSEPDILDPIGQPKEVYAICLSAVKDGVERVSRWLENENSQGSSAK